MEIILPVILLLAIVIQLIYILFIFTKVVGHQDFEADEKLPPVSIIIAASNELENLRELLPILDKQDYPDFEILIADDRSSDGTYDYLLLNEDKLKHLSFLRVLDLPFHFTAKKYAVTMAVKKAKHEILLFTDADCRPMGDQWIKTMVSQMTEGKEIVLGFSKYQFFPGKLNSLIRYETFQTALQYLSFALAGVPFMGVGRNLLYKKSLFWKNNGFTSHFGLLSGDDDLFINETATGKNVAVSISEDGYTESEPKKTWSEWFVQKRRHLSVGKKYKFRDKLNIGLLWLSGLTVWFSWIPVFFLSPDWYYAPDWSRISADWLKEFGLAHWYPFNDWMRLVIGVWAFWLIIKWIVLAKANNRMGNTIKSWKIPYYDFLYAIYLLIFGIVTIFSNPKKIRWK
ncbi:MAG: glycosyltransferase [Cytophagaceae bacterium]|nr:glycosyltransferase [Cytophagaceae bacterium]